MKTIQTKIFDPHLENIESQSIGLVGVTPDLSNQSTTEIENRSILLTTICQKVYLKLLARKRRKPRNSYKIKAEFYPYSNLKITLRLRKNCMHIRMSDILMDAPDEVLEAAAYSIIPKILKLKIQDQYREIYRNYIYSKKIRHKKKETRRVRANKNLSDPCGNNYDLNEIFIEINKIYFNSNLKKPILTWSKTKSRVRLGHYDPDLNILVISKKLDNKQVPKLIIDYILYHELLHMVYPGKYLNGKWTVHTKEFKNAEKEFKDLKTAKEWIKNNKF